jgi:hypothetical protein
MGGVERRYVRGAGGRRACGDHCASTTRFEMDTLQRPRRLEDIRECIGCNICVSKFNQVGQIMCTQNQTIGEEYRRGWNPEIFQKVKNARSVLVVGAGPAGMECARVLGERGYTVHLRDAEAELGGHWKWVSKLPRLNEWGRVITYRQAQLAISTMAADRQPAAHPP